MCTPVAFGKEAEMIDIHQNLPLSLDVLLTVSHVTDDNRCINLFLLQNWSVSPHIWTRNMSKGSPVKSLSVRDGKDGKRSLHVKRSEKSYQSIANFYFKMFGMVEFALPEFQRMNGYLLDVVRSSDGVSM